jgi:RHS repeat-associated protein
MKLTRLLAFLGLSLGLFAPAARAISSTVTATATNSAGQPPSFNITLNYVDGGYGAYAVYVFDTPVTPASAAVWPDTSKAVGSMYIAWTNGTRTLPWSDPRGFTFNGTKTYTFVVLALNGPYSGWWYYSGTGSTTCNGPTGSISATAINNNQGPARLQLSLNNNGYGSGITSIEVTRPYGGTVTVYSGAALTGTWSTTWNDPYAPAPDATTSYTVTAKGMVGSTPYALISQLSVTTTPFTVNLLNGPTVVTPTRPNFQVIATLNNTITDDNGNSETNYIKNISITDYSQYYPWSVYPYAGTYTWNFTDNRSNNPLSYGSHTYLVRIEWTDYEAYNDDNSHEDPDTGEWIDDHDIGIRERSTTIDRWVTYNFSQGATQTITFPAIGTRTYGDAPITLSATASSGLPVTYAVLAGPATVSGNTLTITGTGGVTVEARQAGGVNNGTTYASASPVSQSFNIGKANQTINFPAISNRVYGSAPFTLSATSSSGLPVSFVWVSGNGYMTNGNTVNMTGAGPVTVAAYQSGDANYNAATQVNQSFTVTPASQTITFPAIGTHVYGDPNFSISASASSGLPVTFSIASGPATVSGSWITMTGLGTVTVTANQAGNANYAAASTSQSFTVATRLAVTPVNGAGEPARFQIVINNGGRGVYPNSSYYGAMYVRIVDTTSNEALGDYYPTGTWIPQSNTSTWTDPRGILSNGTRNFSFTLWSYDPFTAGWYTTALSTSTTLTGAPTGTLSATQTNNGVGLEQFSLALNNAGYGQGVNNIKITDTTTGRFWNIAPPGSPVTGSVTFAWTDPGPLDWSGTHTYTFLATGTANGYAYRLPTVTTTATNKLVNVTPLPAATFVTGSVPKLKIDVPAMNTVVTDDDGNTETNHINYIHIYDTSTGWSWDVWDYYGASTLNFTWSDPRGAMTPGTHNYQVSVYYTNYQSYNDENEDGSRDIGIREDENVLESTQYVTVNITSGTPQSITFPAIAAKTFGDTPFALNATASSGLPVSYTVTSGPATISGSTVTITGVGTVTIQATQSGGTNAGTTYMPATPVSQSFAVNKAGQTISFPVPANHVATDAPFTISATASSGLPVSFAVTSGPATISGSTVTLTGATGTVTITASQAGNANYNAAANVSQSFTVNPPAPVINSAATASGTATVAFTYTITATNSPTSYTLTGTLPSGLSFNSTTGVISGTPAQTGTYSLTIGATNGAGTGTASLSLSISPAVPPSITTQPSAQTVGVGANVNFSVTASGTPTLAYQWRKNGTNIAGATSATFALTNVQTVDAASYSVVVSNGAGSTTSATAALTVYNAPVITAQPAPQSVTAGNGASFSVTAVGAAPLAYQWRKGGVNIPNATNATYTIGSTRDTDAGSYTVVVSNSAGSVTSNAATLTVTGPSFANFLTVINGTASAAGGDSGTSVTITANDPPAGQYFIGWTKVSGAGWIQNLSLASTSFNFGYGDATIRADYSSTPPSLGITYNEINLPSTLTVADYSQSATLLKFTGLATNSGNSAWAGSVTVNMREAGNIRSWSTASTFNQGGVSVGQKSAQFFSLWQPTTPGTYTYTFDASQSFMGTGFGPTITKTITFVAAGAGARPVFPDGFVQRYGTVGAPLSISYAATNSPTSYSLVGTLPPGVTFNTSTGLVSGTPTTTGDYAVTIVATNSAGTSTAAAVLTIYPNTPNALTVMNGSGSTSNLPVGTAVMIAANTPAAGDIFNGWTVVSGPATLADANASTTTVSGSQPGNITVRANYIPGFPLTVQNGTSTPLGGVAGAAISISANPDANGQMFSSWTAVGPGAVANPNAQNTTYTMGSGAATVTANYVPGYRVTVASPGSASATGGLPGSVINISAPAPATGQSFQGWSLSGPGYLADANAVSTSITMGAGSAYLTPYYWDNSLGQPVRSYITSPVTSVGIGQTFNIILTTTDTHGSLYCQELDYSTDNGVTWTWGTVAAGTRWENNSRSASYPGAWQYTVPYTFNSACTVLFRGIAAELSYGGSPYAYYKVTVAGTANSAPSTTATAAASGYGSINGAASIAAAPTLNVPLVSGGVSADFTITNSTTDANGDLRVNVFDLSTDGGTTWSDGNSGNNRLHTFAAPGVGSDTLAKTFALSQGTYLFRARGQDNTGQYSSYQYVKVAVATGNVPSTNINAATSGATPVTGSSDVANAQTLTFSAGQSFTITSVTSDPNGDLISHAFDYSSDNGATWNSGNASNQRLHTFTAPGVGSDTLAKTFATGGSDFGPGTLLFRSRGTDNVGQASAFQYVKVTITPGTGPVTTISASKTGVSPVNGSQTSTQAPTLNVALGADFTITSVTNDPNGDLVSHAFDYSTDNGATWNAGNGTNQRLHAFAVPGVASDTLAKTFATGGANFGVGNLLFRARGSDNAGQTSAFQYIIVSITNTGGGTTGPDADSDGIPDQWEKDYGLDPNNPADAKLDLDNDGLTNVAEYQLGTHPRVYNEGQAVNGAVLPAGWPTGTETKSILETIDDVGNTAALTVVPGTTSGSLGANPDGSVGYSVPIAVIPGTSGMQPTVSLSYNSNSGRGLAGFGWSLGATSAISRGPRTKVVDGYVRAVGLDNNDALYLDGQRLIKTAGTDFTNGAEYRTQNESFSRIIYYTDGTNSWFRVWSKAGLVTDYGREFDSAFKPEGGSAVMTWSVSRITDVSGNSMLFRYAQNQNGESDLRLTQIDYTENVGAGISAYASVQFDYESRPDFFEGYTAGKKLRSIYRLAAIRDCNTTTWNVGTVRTYKLYYHTRGVAERSVLWKIVETARDGRSYQPLVFDYEAAATGGWVEDTSGAYISPTPLAFNNDRHTGSGFMDVNGDGRADIVWANENGSDKGARLNTGSGFATYNTTGYLPPMWMRRVGDPDTGTRMADVNSDGLVDVIWCWYGAGDQDLKTRGVALNDGTQWVVQSNSSSWLPPTALAKDDVPNRAGYFFDIDGDGRADLVSGNNSQQIAGINGLVVYRNTGSGWAYNANYSNLPGWTDSYARVVQDYKGRFVDLNGDGLVDIVIAYYGNGLGKWAAWLNTGSGWAYAPGYVIDTNVIIATDNQASVGAEFTDVNGDGLVDLVWSRESGSYSGSGCYLNTGTGWIKDQTITAPFKPPMSLSRDNTQSSGATFLDVNNDGIVDLVRRRRDSATDPTRDYSEVYLGTGHGWSQSSDPAFTLKAYLLTETQQQPGNDFVDLDGDGYADHLQYREAAVSRAWFNRNHDRIRLTRVTNGMGVPAAINYGSMLDPNVYTKGAAGSFPEMSVIGAGQLVSSIDFQDGEGGSYSVSYKYNDLRVHALYGSLGFASVQSTDSRTGIVSTTDFWRVFPFIGMPKTTTTQLGTKLISQSSITPVVRYPATGPEVSPSTIVAPLTSSYFIFNTQVDSITRDIDTNNSFISRTLTSTDCDADGNAIDVTVESLNADGTATGFKKVTTSTYDPAKQIKTAPDSSGSGGKWILGRLTRAKVDHYGPSIATITRTSDFEYDPNNGLLTAEIVEPTSTDPDIKLRTSYGYDAAGNKQSVTVGEGAAARTTTTLYDSKKRYPASSTNALNHTETYGYDQDLGVRTLLTGPNNLSINWTVDAFGNVTREDRPDNTYAVTSVMWNLTGQPSSPNTVYFVQTQALGSAPSLAFYDRLGRARVSRAVNGNGQIVETTTTYDALNHVSSATLPHFNDGSAIYSASTTYDELGRPLTSTTPDDEASGGFVTTSYQYEGLVTKVTDPKNRIAKSTKNSQGWVTETVRNSTASTAADDYTSVAFTYDALGNVKTTTAAGAVTSFNYDLRGRKTSMTDPDMGTWSYLYNAFGELRSQTDAKTQTVTLTYDKLGRMETRTEAEGTTTWTYDQATGSASSNGKWLGKPYKSTTRNASSVLTYEEEYAYDAKGRPTTTWRTIPSAPFPGGDGRYFVTQTYDSYSRTATTIYPTNFRTRNVYNGFGFLKEVRKYDAGDDSLPISQYRGFVYWQADTYNAAGKISGEYFGNGIVNDRVYSDATGRLRVAAIDAGRVVAPPYAVQYLQYTYDTVGNVKTRFDGPTNRSESFEYDGLDRLTSHTISGGSAVTVSYLQNGNIRRKSDVGTADYGYDSIRVHAVTSAGGSNYGYDNNGNMTSGGGRALTWTSFNQLKRVDMSGGKFSEFEFGAAHERVKQTSHLGTTVYIGSLYEKVTGTGASPVTEHKHYIYTPTGRVAVYTERSNAVNETRWFHSDGLGSITAVSDEAGRIVQRFAYDAWGKRTNPANNQLINSTNNVGVTRGYTDHEHLDDLGLIHMNGRVYDPTLGRFLSADPYIDGVSDSQSWNRYSYVNNNPLNHTDPSGFFKLKDAFKIVAIVVVGVITAGAGLVAIGAASSLWAGMGMVATMSFGTGWAGFAAAVTAGAGFGFGSGFAGSLLNGGSIGDAFKAGMIGSAIGAVTGGITFGINASGVGGFGKMLAHGAAQGAVSEATGGEFRHGFIAGIAMGVMGPSIGAAAKQNWFAGMIVQALVGGTASELSGSKFANGAVSAATFYALGSPPTRSQLNPSAMAEGVGIAGKMVIDRVIGENYGAAWRSMFTEKWVDGPTGGKLPQSLADGMSAVGSGVPANAAANGMHAWHAGSNAYLAGKLGLIGAPALFAGGLFHESPLDWDSFKAEQSGYIDQAGLKHPGQGTVNHILDSTMDIVANVFGMGVGYLNPNVSVPDAVSWGNYIPGPGDPDQAFGGVGHEYNGKPWKAWGGY